MSYSIIFLFCILLLFFNVYCISTSNETLNQRNETYSDQRKVVLCTISKYEDLYIDQWILYYLKLGFDHFYIYDNSLEFTLSNWTNPFKDIVTLTHFPGTAKQVHAMNECIHKHIYTNTWVAVFDMDEYLVLKTATNIHGFIEQTQPNLGGQISINWKFCGSNNHKNYSSELIVKRFTKCQIGLAKHLKPIVYAPDFKSFPNPHFVYLQHGKIQRDTLGNSIVPIGPFNHNNLTQTAILHHYGCKSYEEFLWKIQRGRAMTSKIRGSHEFSMYDKNNEYNDDACRFYLNDYCQQR